MPKYSSWDLQMDSWKDLIFFFFSLFLFHFLGVYFLGRSIIIFGVYFVGR